MSKFFANVCLNGHCVVEKTSSTKCNFCTLCGAEMISCCPHCNHPIEEWDFSDDYIACIPKFNKPMYCKICGTPYPWTQTAISAATLMIEESSELTELDKESLKDSLPDIFSETPKTQLASIRFKKALLKAGDLTADALRQFVIDFGCELFKSAVGL